ncbi:MAG: acylphosphatase [Bacteroidales bacterium]|jgi:acylphosphatase|nr:acylphosphatase [Bacteroidales bacterium]
MIKHLNITIHTENSTPGYRFAVMEKAYKLGISGYIRRKKSGGFYIEAEGEDENVELFSVWCKKGPLGCTVLKFQAEEGQLKNHTGFDIKNS